MFRISLFYIGILFCQMVSAHSIDINVNGFIGQYFVDSGSVQSGDQTFDLVEGTHTLKFDYGGEVEFEVDSNGAVTSTETDTLSFSGSDLELNNIDIFFDVGLYNQVYTICQSSFLNASSTFKLPIGVDLSIVIPNNQAVATFKVDGSGNITVSEGDDVIEVELSEIHFKTVKVTINPQVYKGVYAFVGGSHLSGVTDQYFFPNAIYQILAGDGSTLSNISTDVNGLNPISNTRIITSQFDLKFFSSKFSVTPPVGYTNHWNIFGHANKYGVSEEWLIRGAPTEIYVDGVPYSFTSTSNCSDFGVSTPAGTFSFECENNDAFYFLLSDDTFSSPSSYFDVYRYDGRFYTMKSEYDLTVNGVAKSLDDLYLTVNTFSIFDIFTMGRNVVILDGKDANSNAFQITKEYWLGDSNVTVYTLREDDVVTLTVAETIGGNTYSKSVVGQAADHRVVFNNVPRTPTGTVTIETESAVKVLKGKFSRQIEVSLELR